MFKNAIHWFNKFTHSLSFKLSFYAGLIMFLAIIVFSYQSISTQENNLINKMIQESLKDSEVIKAAIWNGMMTKDREVIRQIVKAIGEQERFKEISVYDNKGDLHYSSRLIVSKNRIDPSVEPLMSDFKTDVKPRHRISKDGKSIIVVNPLVNTGSCSASGCHSSPEIEKTLGVLQVKLGLEGMNQELLRNTSQTVIFAVSLFLLISTASGLGVIWFINPKIRQLQEKAAKMARGEYDPRGKNGGSDEMAELIRSFDRMSLQINQRTMELDASRKLYKSLFDEVPCYLTVLDRNLRIVRANRAFVNEFGDQIGKNCFSAYKNRKEPCVNCPVAKTFEDGAVHQSEEVWRLHRRDCYVMVKTSPIFDDKGKVYEVLEMAVDVTLLKRLQFRLERKQYEFRRLFSTVPCYLTVVDRDFNIVTSNDLFDRDFGSSAGRKCFQAYKNSEHQCDNCPVAKTFNDGKTHYSEEIWRQNGEETYIVVYTAPIHDDDGNIISVMEMSTNITEVKRLQGELAILGETIAGMSHTIKNILSGLQGGVYVVDSGLTRGKEDKVRTGWAMVKNNVEKISDLVKGILYASKERAPEYREYSPSKLLSEVCDLYEVKAKSQGVNLVRSFDDKIKPCLIDPAGIHSAISNLVSNAIYACKNLNEEQSHTVTVSCRMDAQTLVVEVSDDGEGMPEEVRENLFKKFYSTKGSRGTGLGLVITRKVVHEHGGSIRVESKQGVGTTFVIEIPVNYEQAPPVLQEAS
jgi:PAS domain S-box-containing protein